MSFVAFAVSFFFVYLVKHLNLYILQRFILVYILRNYYLQLHSLILKSVSFLSRGVKSYPKLYVFCSIPVLGGFVPEL